MHSLLLLSILITVKVTTSVASALDEVSYRTLSRRSVSTPSEDINYSNEIAIRKLEELNRETVESVVAKIPEFIANTYKKADEQTGQCTDWLSAMQAVVNRNAEYLSIGGPPLADFRTTMRRVSNAKGFFDSVIQKNWQDGKGSFESWAENVTNGQPIPGYMMAGSDDVTVSYPFSWWSPDKRMDKPTSVSMEQGNKDFLEFCEILSLAPEWYPYGLVSLEYEPPSVPQSIFLRPSSYNGLMSPLWVQHPENVSAGTGDKAKETIATTQLTLNLLKKQDNAPHIRVYPVTPDLTKALKQSPGVLKYSVDVNKVSGNKLLGSSQKAVIEDVNNQRKKLSPQFESNEMRPDIAALIREIQAQPRCGSAVLNIASIKVLVLPFLITRKFIGSC